MNDEPKLTDVIDWGQGRDDQDAMNDARITGDWIFDGGEWRCSICGQTPWYNKNPMESGYKFCPYCGKRIKGE